MREPPGDKTFTLIFILQGYSRGIHVLSISCWCRKKGIKLFSKHYFLEQHN